jgi:hypothetical protein
MEKQLKKRNNEYKQRVCEHRRKLEFEVGYQILEHLSKERFPRGTYNKLKLKNIGQCKILRRFGENSYEIEMLGDVGISPIFNIADISPYRGYGVGGSKDQKNI